MTRSASHAVHLTCDRIEEMFGKSHAFRRVDRGFYVVRQGSAFIFMRVLPWSADGALIRMVAQLAKGVEMTPDLAIHLLGLNAKLRFGSFGWVREGSCVTLQHTMIGGPNLEEAELLTTLRDVALVADEYDDVVVGQAGGKTMQALLEEQEIAALQHALASDMGDRPALPR
jgi:hypothetical protein